MRTGEAVHFMLEEGRKEGRGGERRQRNESDQESSRSSDRVTLPRLLAENACGRVLECMNGLITCTDLPVAALASKTNWACAVIPYPLSTCLKGRPTLPLNPALFWLLFYVLHHLLSAQCEWSSTPPLSPKALTCDF